MHLPRLLLLTLLLTLAPWTVADVARACCMAIEPAAEAQTSRYVFEGTVVSVSGTDVTFLVSATWRGAPPARVTARWGWRSPPPEVGQHYLVFAYGEDDGSLSMPRCGSSAPLDVSQPRLAALRAAGLTRVER